MLEYVKNSGSENEETNTYIKSIMDKTGLILSLPVLSLPLSMMFATMAAKVLEDVKGIKAKTFDAILLEINNRYNIFLEKIPNEMRLKINSIHLTEFAVLLDLSKVENSNKLLLDKLKKILTTKL